MLETKHAIFLSYYRYVSDQFPSGGVKLCTDEFINLLRHRFKLHLFTVETSKSFLYRVKVKSGFNAYDDFDVDDYSTSLRELIAKEQIEYVFLNLSNTIKFAKLVKAISANIKVILCSHGNESGDYLHDLVIHRDKTAFSKRLFGDYILGKILRLESHFRNNYLDMVLTVSEVEENIEKWLGSPLTFMVPRVIFKNQLPDNTIPGRVGFFGDLSHPPNAYGVERICEKLKALGTNCTLRLVSSHSVKGKEIESNYAFVNYLGYLNDQQLDAEASTWSFSLNPVFYYSRGVSTKLAKSLGWGIPAISTVKGNRGYLIQNGSLPIANNAEEMAVLINKYAADEKAIAFYKTETQKIVDGMPQLANLADQICERLMTGK